MFSNIQIPSLETFLDEVPEHQTVIVESRNNEHRKMLTKIKNELVKEGSLIEYTYTPKDGNISAKGEFVVEDVNLVLSRIPKSRQSLIQPD